MFFCPVQFNDSEFDGNVNFFQMPRCEKKLKESCIDVFDEIGCRAAQQFCDYEIASPFRELGQGTRTERANIKLIDHF
jgi:hypothetical protein